MKPEFWTWRKVAILWAVDLALTALIIGLVMSGY